MTRWKQPPLIKVYEAIGAIADGRVCRTGEREMLVTSSSGHRQYKVTWSEDLSAFASDDNGSKWQGYVGYPIIATLMTLKLLLCSEADSSALKAVPWKKLNDAHKRNYDAVIESVLQRAADSEAMVSRIRAIHERLKALNLSRYSPPRK